MEPLPAELEGVTVLRNLETKRWAEAILARRSRPNSFLLFVCIVGAMLVAQYAFKELNAPVVAGALLAGMFAGLVSLGIEVWVVHRRLEAIIQLVSHRDYEQA